MSTAKLRRLAVDLLRKLDVAAPLDVKVLCSRLGAVRGRQIELVPYVFPEPSVFGLWLGTTRSDLILFQSDLTLPHQRHIVLHEIGHVFLEHGNTNADDTMWQDLVPSLAPDVVRAALRRSAYDTAAEQEAELFASIVSEWCRSVEAANSGPRSQLEEAFDQPRGWL